MSWPSPALRERVGVGDARTAGDALSEQGVVHHPVGPEEVGADVEHRDHEVVTLSGALAVVQRCTDGLGHGEGGGLVDDDVAHEVGQWDGLALLPGDDGGECLDDRVDDRTVGVRTGGSVPADRHVDHARVARLDVVVAEAQPVHDAGPEVLDHHVGARHELGDQAAPLVGGRVDADPPLPTVVVQQQRTEAPTRERAQPEDVAQPRWLDLHDVGALLRQHHRGQRPRRQLAQVDDPHPLQRLAHARNPLRPTGSTTGVASPGWAQVKAASRAST